MVLRFLFRLRSKQSFHMAVWLLLHLQITSEFELRSISWAIKCLQGKCVGSHLRAPASSRWCRGRSPLDRRSWRPATSSSGSQGPGRRVLVVPTNSASWVRSILLSFLHCPLLILSEHNAADKSSRMPRIEPGERWEKNVKISVLCCPLSGISEGSYRAPG